MGSWLEYLKIKTNAKINKNGLAELQSPYVLNVHFAVTSIAVISVFLLGSSSLDEFYRKTLPVTAEGLI